MNQLQLTDWINEITAAAMPCSLHTCADAGKDAHAYDHWAACALPTCVLVRLTSCAAGEPNRDLLASMRRRFLEAGGVIREHTSVLGAEVCNDGVAIRCGWMLCDPGPS